MYIMYSTAYNVQHVHVSYACVRLFERSRAIDVHFILVFGNTQKLNYKYKCVSPCVWCVLHSRNNIGIILSAYNDDVNYISVKCQTVSDKSDRHCVPGICLYLEYFDNGFFLLNVKFMIYNAVFQFKQTKE